MSKLAERVNYSARSMTASSPSSFIGEDEAAPWRRVTLYEYYWEQNYPHTPTMHALVGDRGGIAGGGRRGVHFGGDFVHLD